MSFKKLSRIAAVAFALVMLLAVSSLAYSLELDGTVSGLEDGIEYTYAQYDFANNAYGEFTQLTDTTVITSGVYGIKAGDAEPEAFFTYGAQSGKTSFWTDGATAADDVFNNTTKDTYLPGKWTISSNGAFQGIRCYKNATLTDVTVCIDVVKAKVIEKKTITTDTQKTVTVEEVAYPVYAIDEVEYYLNGEKYYAVADNTEYTGENAASATAVYLTEITWVGIEGEGNKSQESVYYYGFTNDQVIPMTELVKYSPKSLSAFTGGIPVADGHEKSEISPKVTYFAKKIGSDEVTEYTVKVTDYSTNGAFTVPAPAEVAADDYLVGFAIAPYDGLPDDYFTNLYADGAWNTETNGYFHQAMYTNSSNGVTVVAPTVDPTAPAGLAVVNGKVTGLQASKYYQYANVSINKNGTAIEYSTPATLTADTTVAGLVVVRETNPDASLWTNWTTEIFYAAGDGIGNIIHTTAGTTSGGVAKDFINVASSGGWSQTALPVYNEAKWTGANLSNSLAKNYGYDPLILGTTGGQGTFSYLNKTDATQLAAAQAQAKAHLDSIYYSYKYAANEVIPMSLFESFKFRVATRQGGQTTTGNPVYTKFTFKVITDDGQLVDRTVTKATGKFATTTHTVTAADFADTTGYIVGIIIHPYTTEDASILKYSNSAMVDYNIYHYLDGYSIVLPKADKPTGLYLDGNVIKGLDANQKYCWAYQYISDKSADTAVPAGSTELTGVTGLVAVMIAGDGASSKNSDPVLFYIPGDDDARATLGVISNSKAAYQSTSEWKAGVWTGLYMSWYDWNQITGTQTFLDQGAGVTAEQGQNLWLYQVTKEEAQARLDADEAKSIANGIPSSWANNNVTSNPARLQAAIDAHYTEDYETTKESEKAALQQTMADGFASRYMQYAYDETEIIPVDQLNEISFASNRRQGNLALYNVKSKVIFYVMQLDGTISEHSWTSGEFNITGNVVNQKITVDVQSIEGLPTEGYIVGVKYIPWSTMDASKIVYVMGTNDRVDASNVAYSFGQQQITMGYYTAPYTAYVIKTAAQAPAVEYAPNENCGYTVSVVEPNSTFVYEYQKEGDTEWTAFTKKFDAPEAAKYTVRVSGDTVIGTAETTVEVAPVEPVAPEVYVAPVGDVYKIKLMNYFGAYTYEYKLASATEWTKVAPGAKYFTLDTADSYVVRAGGITYDGYAETAFVTTAAPAAIEAITFDTDTVTLDANVAYEYAEFDMYGAGEYTAIPAGSTSFTFESAGLWAVRLAATETEPASVAKVFLVLGPLSDSKTIINTKSVTYANGTWYDKTANVTIDTVKIQAYSDRLNPEFVEGVWTGYKIGDLAYWNKDWQYALGVVSGCVNVSALGNKLTDGTMTQQEAKDFIATYGFRYKYEPAEIIPFEDMVSFTFTAGGRQGHIKADGVAYTKVIAHVATDYGFVEQRDILLQTNYAYATAVTKHTISATDFDDQSGYIVALEVIPYGYIPETTNLIVDGTTDSDWFVMLHSYQIDLPRVDKPVVSYNAETGLVEGLNASLTYKYAKYTVAGAGEATEVTGVTSLELGTGLWGIVTCTSSDENADSLVSYVHIGATLDTKSDIGTLKTYSNYTAYDYTANDVWEQGKWSGKDVSNHSSFGTYTLGTLGGHVTADTSKAFYTATQSGDAEALEAARATIVAQGNNVKFRYSYNDDEILHVNDLMNLGFSVARRMGSLNLGNVTCKVTFVVVGEDGNLKNYVWASDRYNSNTSTAFSVNPRFIENWPTEGYIVGFQINPWCDIDGTTVKYTYADGTTHYNTMANMTFKPDDYQLVTGDEVTETPVISFAPFNQVITVTNYNKFLKYAYSDDNGETWTEFSGNKFNATKASTNYIVKSLESLPYVESEASEAVTSSPVALVGTSLVLDGQIGLKVYMEVDIANVKDVQHYMTKVNNDFYDMRDQLAYGQGYRVGGGVNLSEGCSWATKIQLDKATGYYYFIIYLPAKDLDNTSFETDLGYWPAGSTGAQSERIQVSNVGLNFNKYITAAKELAAAGDEEFVKALELVETLETYANYADNYFNKGDDAAYASTASTEGVEVATRTNATLEGVAFYGTSLILEDQVTIRHYFTVEDLDAFTAAYDVAGMYGIKGDYIYFDIADIPAQEIGTVQTLTIADLEGNTVYEVNYSVANYIVDMMNDDDANLVSLVNAMYDYYLAAVEYSK